jgi:predicted aspartyl protease
MFSFNLLHPSSRLISSLVAAMLCCSSTHSIAQITLGALTRDGYGVVPIKRPHPNILVVVGTVNGRKARLVLDTGWATSGITLDGDYARALGLKTEAVRESTTTATGRKLNVSSAKAESVVLGNVQIKGVPLFFGIFQGIRSMEAKRTAGVDGFISSGLLRTFSAVVDLHNMQLYLRPPGTGRRVSLGPALRAAGLSEVPFMQEPDGACVVDVEVNGAAGMMIIDTGATLGGVDTRFTGRMKMSGHTSGIRMLDAAGVESETKLSKPATFAIGGVSVRPPDLLVTTYDFYGATGGKVIGLLGMDVLGPNWSIVDFGQQKLYFAKSN